MRFALPTLSCLTLAGVFVIDHPQCSDKVVDHRQLAVLYLENGQYNRSLMSARRALRQHSDDATLHLIAALAHRGLDNTERAFGSFERAILLDPDGEKIHGTLRQICQQDQGFVKARQILERLLQRYPDSARIQASLGWIFLNLQEESRAIELLEGAISGEDAEIFAYIHLSRAYLLTESFDRAVQVLEEALSIDPDNRQLLLILGEHQLGQGRPKEAELSFAKAMRKGETPAITAIQIARRYYDRGMRRKAIEYYEQAMQHGSPGPLLLNNLAWAYGEEGIRLDRALELSLQAVKVEEENVVYLDTYAELLFITGQHQRAIAIMRRALELEPEDGEHYKYLRLQMRKFLQTKEDAAAATKFMDDPRLAPSKPGSTCSQFPDRPTSYRDSCATCQWRWPPG